MVVLGQDVGIIVWLHLAAAFTIRLQDSSLEALLEVIFMEAGFRSTEWQELSFAVIGLGLIGGSFAKALRRLQVRQIIGVEMNKEALALAQKQGIIDIALGKGGPELAQADIVICAIYPEVIAEFIESNVQFFKANALITDAAGIKGNMISSVQKILPAGMEFISGHPMAGRQSSGLAMSSADIFANANYIIVPEHNSEAAAAWLESFAKALGCRSTVRVSPAEHDSIIAYTSNLPHVTAVALMDSASFNDKTKYFVAGSFKDGTRVADINPELWSSLFLANSDKVADEIDKYIEQLTLWRNALRDGDGEKLRELMRTAAARRKELY